MPIISVIIPVYNAEKSLDTCLQSIVEQSVGDLEIICVDDGSTDGSYEKLVGWRKKTDGSKFCGRKTREAARPETSVWQKRRENIFIFWTVTTACSRRLTKPCMRKFAEPGPTCVLPVL